MDQGESSLLSSILQQSNCTKRILAAKTRTNSPKLAMISHYISNGDSEFLVWHIFQQKCYHLVWIGYSSEKVLFILRKVRSYAISNYRESTLRNLRCQNCKYVFASTWLAREKYRSWAPFGFSGPAKIWEDQYVMYHHKGWSCVILIGELKFMHDNISSDELG